MRKGFAPLRKKIGETAIDFVYCENAIRDNCNLQCSSSRQRDVRDDECLVGNADSYRLDEIGTYYLSRE